MAPQARELVVRADLSPLRIRQSTETLTFTNSTDVGKLGLAAAVVDKADRPDRTDSAGSLDCTSDRSVHTAEHHRLVAVERIEPEVDLLVDIRSAGVADRPFDATSWAGNAMADLVVARDPGRS